MSEEEIWKPVVGWEEAYEVSSHGRIKRVLGGPGRVSGRILGGGVDKDGYITVLLMHDGVKGYKRVHRIVCEAFHGPAPAGKPLVLHNDDVRDNNHADNLRWGDLSDNQKDAVRNGGHWESSRNECIRGHDISPESENTYWQLGKRSCRTCRNAASKRSSERRKRART